MGFCIFNNVAIGAQHARQAHGLERILIVDWDLHHGNGTQHAFYTDPGVLYFSTHQYPFYPGTGHFTEIGEGAGRGYTVNIPLSPGYGDADYANIFRHILAPIALAYQPQLILVSAGFDIYARGSPGRDGGHRAGVCAAYRNYHGDRAAGLRGEDGHDLGGGVPCRGAGPVCQGGIKTDGRRAGRGQGDVRGRGGLPVSAPARGRRDGAGGLERVLAVSARE